MLRLYHREGAGRPARVRWALEEVGAAYDHVVLTPDEAAGEEHRRRHPLGRVPVLESDDGLLFESTALCLQVADLHPEAGLIAPPGTHERGAVYQWAIFAMTELEPPIVQTYRDRQAGDDAAATAAEQRMTAALAPVEAALGDGREHIVGERFTIADVVLGSVLAVGRRLEVLPESARAIGSYLARLDERPARRRAYENWLTAVPPARRPGA
jgi:glutathione S-transferase